ncbi:MAG TPA: hemolysin D [Ghiorsea sp.]|nr:hemolysin D [Ghiorsea sp.]
MKFYSPLEEGINVYSHVLGIILSVVGLITLIIRAASYGDVWQLVSVSIYGISLIILFTASSVYHASKDAVIRSRLRVFDHASIYVMIAGTYTPFTLVTLSGTVGWTIFGITWGMAIIGIVLKLFYTGHFKILSTAMYLLMGWMIVFAIQSLVENIAPQGLNLLIAGGLAYTLGAVLYSIKAIPLNHAIFHVLVLLGSAFHFFAVYFYVLSGA